MSAIHDALDEMEAVLSALESTVTKKEQELLGAQRDMFGHGDVGVIDKAEVSKRLDNSINKLESILSSGEAA